MTHGSLFSGIGGFDLAAEWMGWDNIFHCEWNPFGQKVLKHHFPNSISYNDITKTDFSIHRGKIDILTGGFPCQPYSTAGLRKGKEDERHLFPEMLRTIKEIQPRWVVGENVRGLVSWNGGLVFHEVYDDLEREGYEVQSFLVPAASVNAPHQRYRIWFVAFNTKSQRSASFREFCQGQNNEPIGIRGDDKKIDATNDNGIFWGEGREYKSEKQPRYGKGIEGYDANIIGNDKTKDVANTSSIGFREHGEGERLQFKTLGTQFGVDKENVTNPNSGNSEWVRNESGWNSEGIRSYGENGDVTNPNTTRRENRDKQYRGESTQDEKGQCGISGYSIRSESNSSRNGENENRWEKFPTQSPICGGDDGIPRELDSITFSKWRNESIKAYGNAIVPQVAHQIFKTIQQFENNLQNL